MFSKGKGTAGSFISIVAFVICCGIMVADFDLWWLPICVLPFVFFFNINYKGHWESEAVDEAAEEDQTEEPYSKTWPFQELEETPANSERQELHNKEIRRERKELEHAQEDARLRSIRDKVPGHLEIDAQVDRELRKERKAIEHIEEQAARERILDEYDNYGQ